MMKKEKPSLITGIEKQENYIQPSVSGKPSSVRNHAGQFVKGHRLYKDMGYSYMKKMGESNSNWSGDNISYPGIHRWIAKRLGVPKICKNCHKVVENRRSIHWANVSGKYSRELSDWIALCTLCHPIFDKKNKIKIEDVNKIKQAFKNGESQTSIGRKFGVDQMTISRVITGITNGKKNCYSETK